MTQSPRAQHDLGGVEPFASQSIDRAEHELTQFDKSVDAIMYLLSHPSRRLLRVDELRRAIESLTPAQYHGLAYYEKWLQGIHDLLLEKDVLHDEEVMLKCASIREELMSKENSGR
ncbi:MAG: nitrile hydratase subunit beta [Alphaproteobacteria bacterium]|nr:nitrile hydratase subunit beta [Alphaproteobacteria bacterium]